ncbi:MAG: hypothetical protein A2Y12_14190 [Planctomycetes bacterium GWF2_42_9]|nr:MAG: hypothetical protein A2Y12_14190 [Planctomycetes bacterium GWF2_42_9]
MKSVDYNLIPNPFKINEIPGCLDFSKGVEIRIKCADTVHSELRFLERTFASVGSCVSKFILETETECNYPAEGYELEITPEIISVSASSSAGVFYAIITLRQLLEGQRISNRMSLKCCNIVDMPRFLWRGSLLDICRHYFDTDFIKRYIDILSYHKMNRFHLHLTDDQAWRVEIKRYPELSERAGFRIDDGKKYGGFLTQDDIRELIAYAKERHIMIIPEIEMPGHAFAALSVFPGLSCSGGPFRIEAKWGVYEDVYCAGNDNSFEFLENVLDEVTELFDSPYIHIGGDECKKDRWNACPKCLKRVEDEKLKNLDELQSYFIKRIQKFLDTKNKIMIGWDEIIEGGLADNAIVQIWRGDGVDAGLRCAQEGHKVIMSPARHCYLNHKYDILPMKQSYEFDPVPKDLKDEFIDNIIGIEANVWTEYIPDIETFEFQIFPRFCGLSEIAWSAHDLINHENYQNRLQVHLDRLKKFHGIECDISKRCNGIQI